MTTCDTHDGRPFTHTAADLEARVVALEAMLAEAIGLLDGMGL
jgi:hypothetical protein